MIWYTYDKIDKTNAVYRMVVGERSNGKSYGAKVKAVKNRTTTGKQTYWLRRWEDDIKASKVSLMFSSLIENGEILKITKGKWSTVHYTAGRFYLSNVEDGKYIDDVEPFMFIGALSTWEHSKDTDTPGVNIIVFDEFITRNYYLIDEFIHFQNVLSTIIRKRTDCTIYMLANTVSKMCPYFKEMGLGRVMEQKPGTVDLYTYGDSELTVAVERVNPSKHSKSADKYFAFNNPALKMITSGAWELGIYPHLPERYKQKDVFFTFLIMTRGEVVQCEYVKKDGRKPFVYCHNKTTPPQDNTLIYEYEDSIDKYHHKNIYKPSNKVQEIILKTLKQDLFFYQDNEIGEVVNDYLKQCTRI